jgi:hypothetical protein
MPASLNLGRKNNDRPDWLARGERVYGEGTQFGRQFRDGFQHGSVPVETSPGNFLL